MPAFHRRFFCVLALPLLVTTLGSAPSARAQFVYNSGTATMAGGSATLTSFDLSGGSAYNWIQNGGSVAWIPGAGFSRVEMNLINNMYYTMTAGTLTAPVVQMGNTPNSYLGGTFMTQSGGAATIATLQLGVGGSTYALTGGTLDADIVFRGTFDNQAVFRLNGGVLTTSNISPGTGATNWGYLVFNGGTLRARDGGENWINQNVPIVVGSGGGKIDTAGYNRTINSTFLHDGNAGPIDGGLTKLGEGTLTISSTISYTGATTVEAGTLLLNHGAAPVTTGSSALVVNGGTLALGGTAEAFNSLSGAGGTIDLSSLPLTVNQSTTSTYAGNIVGSGGRFIKSGTGTLVLSGSNSYTGSTTINAGKLQFAKTWSLAPSSLTVKSGATAGFNVGGAGEFVGSQIRDLAAGPSFQAGSFLALDTTNAIGGFYTISDAITNNIGLVKQGGGTLVLSGTNTYTGGTHVTAGTLQFAKTSALPAAGTLTVDSGVTGAFNVGGAGEFTWAGISAVTSGFQNGSWLGLDTTNAGSSYTVSNSIAGGFGLAKMGTGTLVLTGSNTFTGGVLVTGGVLEFNNSSAFGNASNQIVLDGGGLRWGAGTTSDISGRLSLGAGGGSIDTNGNNFTFNSAISGSGTLVKTGSGRLRLSSTNTYTGGTVVNSGTVELSGSVAGVANIRGDLTINSGAVLIANGFNALGFNSGLKVNTVTMNNGLLQNASSNDLGWGIAYTLNNGSTMMSNGGTSSTVIGSKFAFGGSTSVVVGGTGTSVISGRVDLRADGGFTNVDFTVAQDAVLDVTAGVTSGSGAAGFTKLGAGLMIVSASNTYSGTTNVNGGTLRFGNASSLGTGAVAVNGGSLQWATGNTADISSRLSLTGAGGAFDTNGNTVTFASAISGTGALIKTGSGFLRLTSSNSHSGDTTVNGGVIVLAGPTSARGQLGGLDGSRITINSGNINLESNNAVVGTNPFGNIAITINTGGLLSTVNNTTILSEVVMNGGTIETAGGGDFVNGNYIFSDGLSTAGTGKTSSIQGGTVILPTAVNVGTGDTLRMATVIMGNNNLVKNGTGTLLLMGNNTFTGGTQVNGGLIEFSNTNAFGNAANKVTLNGGGLRWATGNTADISGRLNAIGTAGAAFDTNGNNVTLASAFSGSGALTKNGAGTLRLTAANTYTGGTVINSGSLTVAQNNALGSGSVRVQGGTLDVEDGRAFSNDVVLAGGTYRRTVSGDLTGKVDATSDLAGGRDTTASILAGSVGSTSTLITSFSAISAATNDEARESDVYHFVGTGTSTFVLELSLASLEAGSMIGWLSNGEWVLAIDGNTGNTATQAMRNYDGSYTEFLTEFSGFTLSQTIGAYGYDEETHEAWAVLNHNSDFAVIPEPGTVAMLVLGGVALLARRRRSAAE